MMATPLRNLRDLVDEKDRGPFAPVSEKLVEGFLGQLDEAMIAHAYHNMVKALLDPNDEEAVHSVRTVVAIARANLPPVGKLPKNHLVATMVADEELVLAKLGVDPIDYEKDILPDLKSGITGLMNTAEEFVGKAVLDAVEEHQKVHDSETVIIAGPPGSTGLPN